MATSDRELSRTAWRSMTASNQPARRAAAGVGPELVAPLDDQVARLVGQLGGEGPDPTRVTYALATPTTRSMWRGPMPAPVHAPPATGFDDVT